MAFHSKGKAKLPWNTAALEFLTKLAETTERNNFLVLTYNIPKNDPLTGILQLFCLSLNMSGYLEPSDTSKMKLFAKIVNSS